MSLKLISTCPIQCFSDTVSAAVADSMSPSPLTLDSDPIETNLIQDRLQKPLYSLKMKPLYSYMWQDAIVYFRNGSKIYQP